MLIQLDSVCDQPFEWQEILEIAPDFLQALGVLSFTSPSWEGKISFLDPGYYLSGRLDYAQGLACDRCLGKVKESVSIAFELLILVYQGGPKAAEQELEEQDLNVVHVEGDELDTTPIFMEQLQLNVPMRPLCKADCAGLCPQCGANRNEGACGCDNRRVDPRWEALAVLRGSSGNE